MAGTRTPSPSRFGWLFLLVNLFGFPAASFAVMPVLARLATAASAPIWLHIAVPHALGVALLVLNAWLVRAAWHEQGWGTETVAMSAWTGLCLIFFALLGAFSPINLVVRLVLGL